MNLPSAEQTFPAALSRDVDSCSSDTRFLGASHVSSNDLDDLMQDVPNLVFLDDPIESGTWFAPHFVHGLHATQLIPGRDSYQALTPFQPPSKHVSSFNKKTKSKSNACTPATDTRLSSATTRFKGSARISKIKKYPGGASASVIRKRAREQKEHLFQAFAPLEKAKEALKPYSKSSRNFRQKSESLFLQLEKLIDEAICSDDASDSSSMSEASNLEMDSAYGSFSDIPLSDVPSSVFEQRNVHLERQTIAPSSIQNSELHSDEETPRPFQPLSPTYSCTYGPGNERCPYATSRKSDWIRHEESEKNWPQKRTYTTTTSSSSSFCDLSNNGYLHWDNNEGGWGKYNLDNEKRCSNSLASYVNRPRKSRRGIKRNNSGHEAYEKETTSNSHSTCHEALSSEPTNTVSRAYQESAIMTTLQIDKPPTPFWNYLRVSNKALETVNDTYVRREDSPNHKISPENIRIKREPPNITFNSQRSPREYYHFRTHPRCSRELGQLSDWQPRSLNANSKGDKKSRFEYECKCHTGSGKSSTEKDYVIGHQIFARKQHLIDHVKSHNQKGACIVKHLLSRAIFDNQSKLFPHVLVKEWKIRRVFMMSYSGPLCRCSEEYEYGSLLTSSDTISWGDEGNYVFDPSNRFLNNKQTCGPGQQLQDHFFEFARDRKHRAIGHSCKRKSNCSEHQGFGDQRVWRQIFLFWEFVRSSEITEEQSSWMIRSNFKPFRSTSDRPRCQKAKPRFPQSVALEIYLSDYNRSEYLAYLASQHVGGDERSPSTALIHSPCFTSNEQTLSLRVLQKLWVCLFRVPGELKIEHTVNDRRETIDAQDVDTHLLFRAVRAFEPGCITFLDNVETLVLEDSDGDGEHLE
ncbi:hypothetical protein BHYA_0162g00090 [Botrytis hyacinthi]|uniref:Uncharacterized protein n=1 Tax=Botrytis hyacinthi TaxID=278943 RepID=A0A4Z1GLF5_9HELO|nr:hypothetical protein BHYA_0162g00090 [Botrytis hyacinthi]